MKILKVKCLAPTRLDNYLMQQFPALNPGRLNKALRENKIKLNGKKQPLSTRVMAGDEIKLFILDEVLDAEMCIRDSLGPVCRFHRQPGAQPCHLCGHPAGHGCHGADRAVSRRKEARIHQPGHRRRGGCIRPSGRCAVRGSGVSGTAHFQPDEMCIRDRWWSFASFPALPGPVRPA